MRPVLLYSCEKWPTIKWVEDKIAILERKILRRIYRPKNNNIAQ